jgi:hypothetical protein
MIIRQNPVLSCVGDDESKLFVALLARHTIDAIAAFVNSCPRIRSSGYFISTALVECICHVVYILQDSTLAIDRAATFESFRNAYQLLVDFAQTWITAKRALHALSSTVFSGEDTDGIFEAILNTQNAQGDRTEEGPEEAGMDMSFFNDHLPDSNMSNQMVQPTRNFNPGLTSIPRAIPTLAQISNEILLQEGQQQQQQQFRYFGGSGFLQDLTNNYGDLNFDYSQGISGRI